jgi:hypothetical protein
MSVINFLIYCNGVMWFHKSIDAIGKSQYSKYLFMVPPKHVSFHIMFIRLLNILAKRQWRELEESMQGYRRLV